MSFARKPWQRPYFAPMVALVATYILFAVLSPDTFARTTNLVTMARQTSVVGITALGMTLVIATGGIDLSVGSQVALATVVIASLLKGGHGPVVAALGGVAAVGTAGLATGLLVTRLRLAPFIVTLGSMSILRGLAKGLAHEQKIDVDPAGLERLVGPAEPPWLLVPLGVWLAVALAAGAGVVLLYTRFGRHVLAVGSSEAAARLCGIPTDRVRVLVYALAGLLTGVAGILEFGTLTVGDPTDAGGLELDVIAACVIGGASLSGGEGSILGSLVGACLMTVIRTGCTHLGLSNWVQEIVTGVIIAAAVAFDRVRRGRR